MKKIFLLGLSILLLACLGPSPEHTQHSSPGTLPSLVPSVVTVPAPPTRTLVPPPTTAAIPTEMPTLTPSTETATPSQIAFPTTATELPPVIPLPPGRLVYNCLDDNGDIYLLNLVVERNCRLFKEYQAGDRKWGIYEPVEVLKGSRLTADPGFDGWGRWLPGGNMISFGSDRWGKLIVGGEGEGKTVDWYLMDIKTLEVFPLRALYPGGGMPTWSPDGEYVAYVQVLAPWQQEPEIWVADREGNTKRFLTQGDGPAWSPGGDWLAFLRYPYGVHDRTDSEIYLIHPDGSDVHLLLKSHAPVHELKWSHDGRKIGFLAGDIYIVDASAGQVIRVLDVNSSGTSITWSPDDQWLAYDTGGSIYAVHVEQPWIVILVHPQNKEAGCYFPDWGE